MVKIFKILFGVDKKMKKTGQQGVGSFLLSGLSVG